MTQSDAQLPPPPATIHLMGICGTAMGAFAGMLQDLGYTITGSDTGVYPPMSTYLQGLGIDIMEGFVASNLDHGPDVAVVGNVMRSTYEESEALVASSIPYTSMPSLLGQAFLEKAHSIVVSGTHGKTTTTAITAWLLESAGRNPGYLVGGVMKNFDRTARAGGGEVFVIEGDEYDTAFFDKRPKFVHYRPNTAILTSIEFDHADIYEDLDHIKRSFQLLLDALSPEDCLIARWDDPEIRDLVGTPPFELWTYGPEQMWDGRIISTDTQAGTMVFRLFREGQPLGDFTTMMVGEHNLYNQVAAAAAAIRQGVTIPQLQEGFKTFQGIKRRQEVLGEPGNITVLDDFAHHPTAVKVTLEALRLRFGGRRLWAVWEPRSNTSRRDTFQDAYASAFDTADYVVIAPPHDQSRIPEEERFSAGTLVQSLTERELRAMTLPDVDSIAATLIANSSPYDVIAILSNGGFGGLHQKVLEGLKTRFEALAHG